MRGTKNVSHKVPKKTGIWCPISPETQMNNVFKTLFVLPKNPGWFIENPLDSGVIFIKKSGGIVPELIMNQYFSQLLLDGWETPFVAPNGSPLNGEYIGNMETPSSLAPS